MKTRSLSLLALLSLSSSLFTGCGSTTAASVSNSTQTAATADANIQAALQSLSALSSEQQLALAQSMGSTQLLEWAQTNSSATADVRNAAAEALLKQQPTLAAQIAARSQNSRGMGPGGAMGGPGGMPPGGGMGPGGLPPNIEEIRTQYPELATALESMQSLTPEERQTKMEALFTEHPEWREALMPAGGMPPGGAGGMPPSGMGPGGTPPSGPPPSGLPAPRSSATTQA